nr:hypothetical protein [Porticoccus sp.]
MYIEATEKGDTTIHNQHFAMITAVIAPGPAPAPAVKPAQFHAVTTQVILHLARKPEQRARRVNMHLYCDTRLCPFNKRLTKPITYRVISKDVAFQPDTLFSTHYRRKHGCI